MANNAKTWKEQCNYRITEKTVQPKYLNKIEGKQ